MEIFAKHLEECELMGKDKESRGRTKEWEIAMKKKEKKTFVFIWKKTEYFIAAYHGGRERSRRCVERERRLCRCVERERRLCRCVERERRLCRCD